MCVNNKFSISIDDGEDDYNPIKVKEFFLKIREEFSEDSDWEKVVNNIRASKFKDRLESFGRDLLSVRSKNHTVLLFPKDGSEVVIYTSEENNITKKVATKYNKCDLRVESTNFCARALERLITELFEENNKKWGSFYYCLYGYEKSDADPIVIETLPKGGKYFFNYHDWDGIKLKIGKTVKWDALHVTQLWIDMFKEKKNDA